MVAIEPPGDLDDLPDLPTLGYWLGRAFQGHGYASEACRGWLSPWAFEAFETDAIAARAFEDNFRSRGLLRKMGFKPYSMTERFSKALDRRVSNVIVRLARTDSMPQGSGLMSPVLKTERLVLRAPRPEDLDRCAELLGDYEVAKMLSRVTYPYDLEQGRAYLALSVERWSTWQEAEELGFQIDCDA